MKNPIQWLEITTTNLERAKDFYSNIFNLEFQLSEMPEYKMYMFGMPNSIGSAGALVQDNINKPSVDGTVVYFSCENLSTELERVEGFGGKILIPRTDIGDFGFFAQILDTEGNRIGLHSEK
jgi:predicted enzyme related to lactoylglutathione lyase